jgi:1-aminocyclopropane-1-carboxylate deaminase
MEFMPHNHLKAALMVPTQKKLYQQKGIEVSVLRLDVIHPVISGNKWYKLKAYLEDVAEQHKKTIVTFGGAFSNHIIATAAACRIAGFKSVGIIRGEAPRQLSHTLIDAQQQGMELHFVSREAYRQKEVPTPIIEKYGAENIYVIGEGGYGKKGMEGAMDILKECNADAYTHVVAAVGTGTMLAGLVAAAKPEQQVIGISALKNNLDLEKDVQVLLPTPKNNFTILHQFHFGGYAKRTGTLLQFMNDWYQQTGIPSDFVYTGKLFYAADQLIQQDYFAPGSRILLIHSGGLQGNNSLPKGTLIF